MGNRLVEHFYNGMLTDSQPIDPVMQEAIYRYLLRHKNFSGLGLLAARGDLVDDIDQRLRSRTELPVLAGWVSKPGRTREDLLDRLSKEKRVAALLPLATMSGLPEDVYRRIGRIDSVRLTTALLTNPAAPKDLRIEKVRRWATTLDTTSTWGLDSLIREHCQNDRDLYMVVAESVTCIRAMRSCVSLGVVTPEIASRYLSAAIAEEKAATKDQKTGRHRFYDRDFEHLFVSLATIELSEEDRKRLIASLKRVKQRYASQHYGSGNEAEEALALLNTRGTPFETDLRDFETCTDPARAAERFTALLALARSTKNEQQGRIVALAARHPYLPPACMSSFIEDMNGDDTTALVDNWVVRGENAAIAAMMLEDYYAPYWLERVPNAAAVLFEAIRLAAAQSDEIPYWMCRHELIASHAEAALQVMPWRQVVTAADEFPELRALMLQRIVADLGSDPATWENFDSLADEYDGTFEELIETITAV